jgi:uncharacterized membrane protein
MGPRRSGLEIVFQPKVITIFVLIGVLIFFLGSMVAVASKVTDERDIDDINKDSEGAFTMFKVGIIMMVAGIFLVVLFLLCGSVMSTDTPTNVKVGFLIFSAILIWCTIWLVLGFVGTLRSTGPDIFG